LPGRHVLEAAYIQQYPVGIGQHQDGMHALNPQLELPRFIGNKFRQGKYRHGWIGV
jgi:hypothetical protein